MMIKMVLGQLFKKHGMIGALIKVVDFFVGMTKSKKDDKVWAKCKKILDAEI